MDLAATLGASVIGLNPLHALFLGRPQDASPYSPSSRIFLNPLYIDVEAVPEFAICPEVADEMAAIAETLAACRARSEVAYRDVQSMKLRVLGVLYAHFLRTAEDSAATRQRHAAFNAFREQHGEALRRYAIFEALSEQFAPDPWQSWPEAYHNPDSPEVSEFVRTNTGRIGFFEYLQWVADAQLGAAQERALQQGLCIGIYRDLAVGADRAGADAWSDQSVIVQGGRLSARSVQHARAGLGNSTAASAGDARQGLQAVHRYAARQYAPCGRAAHRPRDGVDAPVLDPGPRRARGRRLRQVSVRRNAGDPGVGEPAQPLPRCRRGPGHGSRRVSRADGGFEHPLLPGALLRKGRGSVQAARRVSVDGARMCHHP
ncbi:MAG: 4-alpha-glucanotransferase [Defluviicoccus sp.]|nr:MAG: 4-alpha-glucanotransferase [Defluviicoccus sp.]